MSHMWQSKPWRWTLFISVLSSVFVSCTYVIKDQTSCKNNEKALKSCNSDSFHKMNRKCQMASLKVIRPRCDTGAGPFRNPRWASEHRHQAPKMRPTAIFNVSNGWKEPPPQLCEAAQQTIRPRTTAASLQLQSGLQPMTSDLSSTEKHLWFIKSCQKTCDYLSLPHVFTKEVWSCNTKGHEAESLGTFQNRKKTPHWYNWENNPWGAPAAWGSKPEIKEVTFLEDLGER